jgi:hypothetical protein
MRLQNRSQPKLLQDLKERQRGSWGTKVCKLIMIAHTEEKRNQSLIDLQSEDLAHGRELLFDKADQSPHTNRADRTDGGPI